MPTRRLPHLRTRSRVAVPAALLTSLAVAGGVVATDAGAALRSPKVVSVEANDTLVGASEGWIVWSRRQADGYHLVARRPDGTGVELPAPVADHVFDAGIGPGPGGPVVVYSRCTGTSGTVRTGCDVWRLDPQTGEQAPVPVASRPGVDEQLPAVSGDRIAFSTAPDAEATTRSSVAVARLDDAADATPTIVAGPRSERVRGTRRTATASRVGGIALRGTALAFSWTTTADRTRWRLLTASASARTPTPRTQLTVAGTTSRVAYLGRPALDGRWAYAPLLRTGGDGRSTIVRVRRSGAARAQTLASGFTSAQTERYGSGITAVANADGAGLVALRRLASDGRGGCTSTTAGTARASGCEVLTIPIAQQRWRSGVR